VRTTACTSLARSGCLFLPYLLLFREDRPQREHDSRQSLERVS